MKERKEKEFRREYIKEKLEEKQKWLDLGIVDSDDSSIGEMSLESEDDFYDESEEEIFFDSEEESEDDDENDSDYVDDESSVED